MVDLYIILFFLVTVLIALFRGVVSEFFDLLTFTIGLVFALSVFEIPGQALFREMHGSREFAFIISFLLVFIPVGLLFAALGLRFSTFIKEKIPAFFFYGFGIPIAVIKSLIVIISVILLLWSSNIKPYLKKDLCESCIASHISSFNPFILIIAEAITPPTIVFKVKSAIAQQEMYKKERSINN